MVRPFASTSATLLRSAASSPFVCGLPFGFPLFRVVFHVVTPSAEALDLTQASIKCHEALTAEERFVEITTEARDVDKSATRQNYARLFFSCWTEPN